MISSINERDSGNDSDWSCGISGDVMVSVRTIVSSNDIEKFFCVCCVSLFNEMMSVRFNVSSNDMVWLYCVGSSIVCWYNLISLSSARIKFSSNVIVRSFPVSIIACSVDISFTTGSVIFSSTGSSIDGSAGMDSGGKTGCSTGGGSGTISSITSSTVSVNCSSIGSSL